MPEIYTPLGMEVVPEMRRADFLMVIGRISAQYGIAEVREEMKGGVAALTREYPEANEGWTVHLSTLQEELAGTARPRFTMLIIAVIAVVALLLAGIGVYGVISYAVTQRTREIGIRVALGATPGDLIAMVVRQGLGPVAAGVLIGIAGAIALTRLIESLLFGVSPTDPFTYAGVAAGLILVAMMASNLPARRAVRVEPMEALRHD